MSKKKHLNLHRENTDWRGQRLCPLKSYAFVLDGHMLGSVEGFVLTLRLPANDKRRIETTMEDADTARRVARRLVLKPHAWWNNRQIETDSDEFEHLFERMMRARFRKDRRAIAALMASRGLKLVHERPRPRAPLSFVPTKLYCKVLNGFRKELFKTGEIAKLDA